MKQEIVSFLRWSVFRLFFLDLKVALSDPEANFTKIEIPPAPHSSSIVLSALRFVGLKETSGILLKAVAA
jgi:hypothetical protein